MGVAHDTVAGEARAAEIERVYREGGARMWHAILAFAGDREVANDAVAEAFAQALRRGDQVRDPERWIWRAVFRIAAGELKDRSRRMHERTLAIPQEMEEPARDLVGALSRLTRMQRGAVVLHHLVGHPVKETAAILGSTPAAVKVHLSRGRRRLRTILEEEDDEA